jgi:A/G-specific adenine glycosylase
MDLGATTCLARIPRCGTCPLASACLSRGVRDAAARKQSPFEGSFRQRRAAVLRTVAAASRGGEGMETAGLDEAVVGSLVRDGLVSVDGDRVRLPD